MRFLNMTSNFKTGFTDPRIHGAYDRVGCEKIRKMVYDHVVEKKPKRIIEFGAWNGLSAVLLAQGLRDLFFYNNDFKNIRDASFYNELFDENSKKVTKGTDSLILKCEEDCNNPTELFLYDLYWDSVSQNGNLKNVYANLKEYNCLGTTNIKFEKRDFYEWIKAPEQFDILHLDIHNSAQVIEKAYYALEDQIEKGSIILIEGGHSGIHWRDYESLKYKLKYFSCLVEDIKPGLSIIKKQKGV
tara:strand:- start:1090 stop:1818 length:729 start_codon:yes stop_codon:yes gene_type:complete